MRVCQVLPVGPAFRRTSRIDGPLACQRIFWSGALRAPCLAEWLASGLGLPLPLDARLRRPSLIFIYISRNARQ